MFVVFHIVVVGAAVFSWLFADRKRAGEKTSRGAERDSSLGNAFYDRFLHGVSERGNRVQLRIISAANLIILDRRQPTLAEP